MGLKEVYHAALGVVFVDLELAHIHGTIFRVLKLNLQGLPVLVAISSDYEEMCSVFSLLHPATTDTDALS